MLSRPLYKNVLLADDDEDDYLFFRDILKELGNPLLSHATDGQILMRMLTTGNVVPDIIFLDINMPKKNGFQCLKEIRANSSFNDIPIIIMSTLPDPAVISSLYESGANLYINKPNKFAELREAIREALKDPFAKKKAVIPEVRVKEEGNDVRLAVQPIPTSGTISFALTSH